ncbi:MAG: hypothetical protein ACLFUM_04260 [Spirochaetaceae bacterium]
MSALINARTASPDARRRWVISRLRAMYPPYGIGCLTEARIASELGIRKRELMRLFTSREEIIRGVMELELEDIFNGNGRKCHAGIRSGNNAGRRL